MTGVDYFATARRHMVDSQLRPSRVTDEQVIAAMGSIPRELFVPAASRSVAYRDEDIEIAPGRFMGEPLIQARLVQAAELTADDSVLDVCAGTGYLAAVASRLAGKVTALEPSEALAGAARAALQAAGCANVTVVGAAASGPYSCIFVAGAVEVVPDALKAQIADGGRLLAVVLRNGVGEAQVFKRVGQAVAMRPLFNANVRPLPGFRRERAFVF
jgi:protein-L-isoaspartate(D-aspartate) O-methyltransferase